MKISIITVCLNESLSIERTLRSIKNQTVKDYELIVIDGGSTDGTLNIIKKYIDIIDILISEKDYGIYDAMNKGIGLSTCDYIYFLNGGDFFLTEKSLSVITRNELFCDIIYGDIVVEREKDTYYRIHMPSKITTEFLYRKSIPHQSALTKKSLFNQLGLYRTDFEIVSDYYFSLKAIVKYGASSQYINTPFACFSANGVSENNIKREKEKNVLEK